MDAQELRNIQEAYLEVYDEGYKDLPVRRIMQGVLKHERDSEQADALSRSSDLSPEQRKSMKERSKRISKKQSKMLDRIGSHSAEKSKTKEKLNRSTINVTPSRPRLQSANEEVDIYDIILSHLLDEGYAETPEAAEAIMVNMSEEWRDSIIG
jgi:predicted nuclease with TOPRIM domain